MKIYLLLSVLLSFSPLLLGGEVSITVDGAKLGGVLSEAGQEKSRIVLILAGSGPTDKDGNSVGALGKNNCLKYLAEALGKSGISTLRIDKRGVGTSATARIKEEELRFNTYVNDVRYWIQYLKREGYTDVVLVGHSEGALVATLAASTESVKGLVCLAGAGRPAPDILREQLKPTLPENLYNQADETISSLTKGELVKDTPPLLNALFRPSVQPYVISWFQIDPVKQISKIQVPVLIVQGSTDLQVSTKDANLLHAGAKGSKLVIIEGMNHVLKAAQGGLMAQMSSYLNPDLPLHKDLAEVIIEFIKAG